MEIKKLRYIWRLGLFLLSVAISAGTIDCSSGTSSSSNSGSVKPNPPANLIASIGNTQVPLTWQVSAGATSYNIYSFTPVVGTAAVMNSFATTPGQYLKVGSTNNTTYTGAINGSAYYFVVTAVNSQGESGYSNTITTMPSPGGFQSDSPWPRFRQNIQSTGLSSVDTGSTTGALKWSYTTGNGVYSSPAIGADGTIYVGSDDSYIHAINPNGTVKWTYPTGDYVESSPAIGTDGTIYAGSTDYSLYAINPNGTLKWSYPTPNSTAIQTSPAIGTDGTIYFGSTDNKLYALNPNGTLKWTYATGGSIYHSSPAIGTDGTIYVGSYDGKLHAINQDGSSKWTFTTDNSIESSPAIGADGTIYVGSMNNYLYAINPDGTVK